jgi:short-subunit dehydrogenase
MENKVIVITGASSGIGAALGIHLSKRGAQVVLVARRKEALESVLSMCGPQAICIVADMTIRIDVQRVIQETINRFHALHVWVNNVGQGISKLPSQLNDEDIDEMMRVNVKSALYCMQEVLPYFQSQQAGHVINVSSMLGRIPLVDSRAAYSGAKHFLNSLTANFRSEVQEHYPEIQFSLVSPGIVATDFGLHCRYGGPDSRSFSDAQSVEDVASVIAQVIASKQADVYTRVGSCQRVADYYSNLGEES